MKRKGFIIRVLITLMLCCSVMIVPEKFAVAAQAEGEINKELVKATTGDHLEDNLVYTYKSSEGTYAFSEPDGGYADQVMYGYDSTRVNLMPVGNDYEEKTDGTRTDTGTYYSVMKIQLDENITNLSWDYACLDLTPRFWKVRYHDGFILEAYLVGEYDKSTVTYNTFPERIEGSPMVEINPGRGANAFEATRCDVTELIKWAVEKGMTNINIKFVRSDKSPIEKDCVFLCTERYTDSAYPNIDFTPTLRLLEKPRELVEATAGDHLEDDLVYTYRTSDATYAFRANSGATGADSVMSKDGRWPDMMVIGSALGPSNTTKVAGLNYGIMNIQVDENINNLDWDYACLDLTKLANSSSTLKAYLVGDYDMDTLTYSNFPKQIEGSPNKVDISVAGNKFQATRCDVTELIKWAVENSMTSINIALESGSSAVYLGTERYRETSYPDSDFTPTMRLLKSTKPTKLEIKGGDRTLNPGDVRYLESNGFDVGEDVTAVFSSSDSSIISVTEDGVLSAIASGDATITLTMGNHTATIAVNVVEDTTSADFKLMKQRWLDYLLISDSEDYSEITDVQIKELSDNAVALWDTMNKAGTERSLLWDRTTARVSQHTWYQFRDLNTIASAFVTKGTELYQNHEVGRALLDALEFMTGTGDYEDLDYDWTFDGDLTALVGNWWDWQIGAGKEFSYMLLKMESYLDDEEIVRYTDILNKYAFDPSKQLAINGLFGQAESANLCDISHSVLIQGLLRNNEEQVRSITADTGLPYAMVLKDGYSSFGNGQYEDGSYIAHRTVAYTGHYGIEALNGIALLGNILGGTSYDFPKETLETYYNYVIEAYLPLLYKGKMMTMVDGRFVTLANYGMGEELGEGKAAMKRLILLSQNADEKYKNIIQSVIKYNLEGMVDYFGESYLDNEISFIKLLDDESIQPMTYQEGIKIYGAMCRTVQTTKDYSAGLALSSKYISGFSGNPQANNKGFYQGTGALYIYNNDLEQFGFKYWPTKDPYRMPGVTANTYPLTLPSGYTGWPPTVLSDNETAGGASNGALAAIAYQFSDKDYGNGLDTKAKKSYFFLENGIVCMGTDISGTTDYTIETTIESRLLKADGSNKVLINGEVFDGTKQTIHLEAGSWIHMEGNVEGADMAYYFPVAIDIEIAKELRTGSYADFGTQGLPDEHTNWYLNIGINHGTGTVSGGQYLYVTLPCMSVDEIKDYAANNTLEIMDGIVEDGNMLAHYIKNDNGTMMAVNYFGNETYKADWMTLDPGNGNISVLVTEDDGVYTLSIANPSFNDASLIEAILSVATDYQMNVESKSDEITVAEDGMSFTVDTTASGAHSFQITFTLEGMPDDDEGDSGNTGSGSDEEDSGNTGSGSDEGDSGNTGSGSDEGDSGNTDSGSDEGDSGNTDSDSGEGEPEGVVSPKNATVPTTGDTSPIFAIIITMLLSGMCILALVRYKKRENNCIAD